MATQPTQDHHPEIVSILAHLEELNQSRIVAAEGLQDLYMQILSIKRHLHENSTSIVKLDAVTSPLRLGDLVNLQRRVQNLEDRVR